MSKKIVSAILVVVMVVAMFAVASVSTSAVTGKVYFEVPESWGTPNKVFCHVWNNKSGEGTSWQTRAERMTKEDDGRWSYDIAIDADMVIFSADSGAQSYDMTMGAECIGDTAYITGTVLENPVDSKKTCEEAKWKNSADKYGPHFAVTSIGNVVGQFLLPDEDKNFVAAKYLDDYMKTSDPDAIVTPEKAASVLSALGADKNDVYNVWVSDFLPKQADKEKAEARITEDEIKTMLGVTDTASSGSDDTSSSSDGSSTAGGNASSSKSSSSASSSTGATTTGDATPYVALAVILVAALGVAVLARKKAQD